MQLKLITQFLLFPFLLFGQGMNIELLRPASSEGFIPYTRLADGRQEYHRLDSLLTAIGLGAEIDGDTLNEIQIFALSDRIVNADTTGATLELSEQGGEVYFEEGNNITIKRIGNIIRFSGLGPNDIQTFRDYVNTGSVSGTTLTLTGVGEAGASINFLGWDNNASNDWTTSDFSQSNINNWNTAYGWGDHSTQGYITATLSQEQVQDFVGSMVSGNTETRISVTYNDVLNRFDFVVEAETDPTVQANVKDGIDWTELTGTPSGFADGVDNTGLSIVGLGLDLDNNGTEVYLNFQELPVDNTPISTSIFVFADGTQEKSISFANLSNTITPAWGNLLGVPAGFADNIDDNTTYTGTNGIQVIGTTVQMDLPGLSEELNLATNDYFPVFDVSQNTENRTSLSTISTFITPNWNNIVNMPAGFADGIDDSGGVTTTGLGLDHANNGTELYLNFTELPLDNVPSTTSEFVFADGTQEKKIQFSSLGAFITPNWNNITNMPSGFADGIDNNNTYTGGNGITLSGNQFQLAINLLSSETILSSSDLFAIYDASQGTENYITTSTLNTYVSPSWNNITGIPSGFADGVDNTGSYAWQIQGSVGSPISVPENADVIFLGDSYLSSTVGIFGASPDRFVSLNINEAQLREYINPDNETFEKSTNQFNKDNKLIYKRVFEGTNITQNAAAQFFVSGLTGIEKIETIVSINNFEITGNGSITKTVRFTNNASNVASETLNVYRIGNYIVGLNKFTETIDNLKLNVFYTK